MSRNGEQMKHSNISLDHYHRLDTTPSAPPMSTLRHKTRSDLDMQYVIDEFEEIIAERGGDESLRRRFNLMAESMIFCMDRIKDKEQKAASRAKDLKAENTQLKRRIRELENGQK